MITEKQVIQNHPGAKGKTILDTDIWHQSRVLPQVSDTDYGGGVYHGRYFALYNQARDAFLADMGTSYRSLMVQGCHLSVAELHTRFVKPVFYGETIIVCSRITWYGPRSLGVIQNMRVRSADTGDDTIRNQAEFNLVCTDGSRAVPLPDRFMAALRRYYRLAPEKP